MSVLFHCEGDDGRMLMALRARLPALSIHRFAAPGRASGSSGHAASIPVDVPDHPGELPVAFDPATVTDAVVWLPPPRFFDGLDRLRRVHLVAAGADHLLAHPGLPDKATVLRLEDAGMGREMAEYVLYGVLHAQRRFGRLARASREGRWAHDTPVRPAIETHVGILGAGAMGLAAARRLVSNGYRASCWSRTPKPLPDGVGGAVGESALGAFLASCDVLVCLLPLTEATRGILSAATFATLPRGAFLINAARGGHLVERDLIPALDAGHLDGALLDVFEREPLPGDHPFHRDPRILVTPHVAAPSPVRDSIAQIAANLEAGARGEPLRGVVERTRGY